MECLFQSRPAFVAPEGEQVEEVISIITRLATAWKLVVEADAVEGGHEDLGYSVLISKLKDTIPFHNRSTN